MLIIYHNRDLDGICSGAILHKRFPRARLFGYDYNEDFIVDEAFDEGECVIMADVSMPMEKMEQIAERSGDFHWIDHHVSAFNSFKEYFTDYHSHEDGGFSACESKLKYVYENGRAACELCFEWAFSADMLEPILLLGKYDTWRENGTEAWNELILPFQYGMRLDGFDPKTLANWIFNDYANNPTRLREVVGIGKAILQYQKNKDDFAMKSSFEAMVNYGPGKNIIRAICCTGVGGTIAFDSVYDESKHDVMVPVHFDGKHWGFGFYTTKEDIDCSAIAKIFGGGGHKKAAGCRVNDINDVLTIL